jgi:hypothetical protein
MCSKRPLLKPPFKYQIDGIMQIELPISGGTSLSAAFGKFPAHDNGRPCRRRASTRSSPREQHHYRRMRSQPAQLARHWIYALGWKIELLLGGGALLQCVNHFLKSWQIILRAAGRDKIRRRETLESLSRSHAPLYSACQSAAAAHERASSHHSLAVIIMLIAPRDSRERESHSHP